MKSAALSVYLALTAAFYVFAASDARAAAVLNLDSKLQVIEVGRGEQAYKVSIEPGHKWETTGAAWVSFRGRETTIDNDEEYAIWDDDTFGPQRRTGTINGNIF